MPSQARKPLGSPSSSAALLGCGEMWQGWGLAPWHSQGTAFPRLPAQPVHSPRSPGGGHSPEPGAAPRKGHVEEKSLCLAQIRRHRRVSKVYFTHRVGGETKQDKTFTVTMIYLQPTSSPKVAMRQRGMGTATNASTPLYTPPSSAPATARAEELDWPHHCFPPCWQHRLALKLEGITSQPSPHCPPYPDQRAGPSG